ncbi:hypothetical protein N7497_001763 [Penicillium chrysogenum]|nr:hypothetical protein N7524_010005 [Penicillium chrysogenum]KAJ6168920.1 hypothetical protein N7497_001763 [Penicillium chrysogenum]
MAEDGGVRGALKLVGEVAFAPYRDETVCLGYDGFSMPLGSNFAPLWLWLGYIMYAMEQSDSVHLDCLVACCSRDGL